MGKPSIGEVVTASAERVKKKDVIELTVLENGSKETLFQLLFESPQEECDKIKQ